MNVMSRAELMNFALGQKQALFECRVNSLLEFP